MRRYKNTKVLNVLENLTDKNGVQVGWFENQRYADNKPIAGIAAVQNFGAVINNPGGSWWKFGKGTDDNGKPNIVPCKADDPKKIGQTKPHTIIIPPRPFMDKTVSRHKKEWAVLIQKIMQKVVNGDIPINQAMFHLGVTVEGDIAKTIASLRSPKLADSTIKNRRLKMANKGITGNLNKPLIDTGLMFETVTHRIIQK